MVRKTRREKTELAPDVIPLRNEPPPAAAPRKRASGKKNGETNGSPLAPEAIAPVEPDGRMHAPRSGVTVRMYRTGLGDCFLLAFPRRKDSDTDRPAFMLIDCGVFHCTKDGSKRMKAIAESIRRATNDRADGSGVSRLDLLVVTHEHWDHVSGFHKSQAQDIFKAFQVGAVWLPWTEKDDDDLARQLRRLKTNTAKALRLAYQEMSSRAVHAIGPALRVKFALDMLGMGNDSEYGEVPPEHAATLAAAAPVLDVAVAGAVSPEAADGFNKLDRSGQALSWIKDHFKEVVRFREPGPFVGNEPDPDEHTLWGVDGVRFYVLGPPRDADLIRRLNPREGNDEAYSKNKAFSAGVESAYFAAFGMMPGETQMTDMETADDPERAELQRRRSRPFDESYRIPIEFARNNAEGFFARTYYAEGQEWRTIELDWLVTAGQFALNVYNLANNSSLALAIELSPDGRVLLFPGDAQIGNWLSWFGKVPYPNGETRGKDMVWAGKDGKPVNAQDLMERTVLYKVGHHGSHNATLKHGGLDAMGTRWPDEFVAMLPVDENVARFTAGYGEMPLNSIVKELLSRTNGRLIRTDEGNQPRFDPDHPDLIPSVAGVGPLKVLDPDHFSHRTSDPDGLYFDYTVAGDE